MTRSAFLRWMGRVLLFLLLFPLKALAQKSQVAAPSSGGMAPKVFQSGKTTRPITPNSKFYIEDISGPPPTLNKGIDHWRLRITGKINHPFNLTYTQILKRPSVRQFITLSCIGNPVGGHAIGNAEWQGISLKALLQDADPHFFARTLIFRGEDGYHDSLPLKAGLTPGALLAYRMNGQTLPREHGYPLRLLVPGYYGIKQMKWIREIEVTDASHQGYWQKRKWDAEGRVQILSRIDSHSDEEWLFVRETEFRGIAFAGDRGIQYVQVSTDGGAQWQLAQLKPVLSPYSWVFWSLRVTFPKSGRYVVCVRAADQFSGIQQDDRRDPFPRGVAGYHRIHLNVA